MKSLTLKLSGLLSCLLLAGLCATAQTYEPASLSVQAKAMYDGTSVHVRWVPTNFETWQWGLQHGYKLERMTTSNTGGELTVGEILSSKVTLAASLLPLPEVDWEPLADANEMAGVAAGVIYGDSLEVINTSDASFTDVVNQNEERENRFGFALFAADNSFEVAEAMGLGFTDNTAEANKEYTYLVTINNVPANTTAQRGNASIATESNNLPPVPEGLVALPGDHSVLLSWDVEGLADHYTSYCVERSSDGGATFELANVNPLIFANNRDLQDTQVQFFDSLATNGVNYVYRVNGKSPFGVVGPYSDTIHVVGRPATLGVNPQLFLVEEETEGALKIEWQFPAEFENKITGFDIYRSDKPDGVFTKINTAALPATARWFVDASPDPVNYYKVKSEDENGYGLASNLLLGQLQDSEPPAAPTGVTGECNETGLVILTWNKNTEEDLMGYRVFMSNTHEGDFTQITTHWINDTVFHYTINLNTLTTNVFFVVRAIDFRQNPSDMSSPYKMDRPDVIPPAAANITNVTPTADSIHFEWVLSSSQDVVTYKFQRKPDGNPGWTTILEFDPNSHIRSYTDRPPSSRQYWDYRLAAIDDAGLAGYSQEVKTKLVDNGIRGNGPDFRASYFGQDTHEAVDLQVFGGGVILGWDYYLDPDIEGFQIYRSIDGSDMRGYKFVSYEEAGSLKKNPLETRYGYVDEEIDFSLHVQTNYTTAEISDKTVYVGGSTSIDKGMVTIVPGQYNAALDKAGDVALRYWVMAKYIDGGMSLLSDYIIVIVPQ